MRISDWSSDVCSSDLSGRQAGVDAPLSLSQARGLPDRRGRRIGRAVQALFEQPSQMVGAPRIAVAAGRLEPARKSVGSGKSVSVRVDLGGRRVIKKNKTA